FTLDAASSPLTVTVTLEDAPVVTGGGGGGGGGGGTVVIQDQPMSTVRLTGLIVGGVGIASGGMAGVMGILPLLAVNNRNANLKQCPFSEMMPMGNAACNQALQYKNQALGFQTVAIITGIGGAALITTGIVLFIVGAPKKQEAPKASWAVLPSFSPEGGG